MRAHVVEFETTLVRDHEFVGVGVVVTFSAEAGDDGVIDLAAQVTAKRVDTGALVDLRDEESEALALRAAGGCI